jgi:predicted phage terminase large subunit-like protein
MLFGGSRSGKTFLLVRAIVIRALKAPGSRHAILRFRFNAAKQSVGLETLPKVMQVCFPSVKYTIDKSDWYAKLPNGSEIWIGGLDDKERTEKILGKEYATIMLNECSQISWAARGIVVTRLAQKCVEQVEGREDRILPLKMYYDENPPDKGHWSFRVFVQGVDPETREPIANANTFAYFQINPKHNVENLPDNYLDTLKGLSARLQRRFLEGEFKEAAPNALFREDDIDKWRVLDAALPDFQRIVVAVDPSGSDDTDNADNDEIGIAVAALGVDGNGYLIEDLTVKSGPAGWSKVATSAFERHGADLIVGETNFGGAMVRQVIQTARPKTPFKAVTASRGKAVRAEPFSSLVEQGKIRFVGHFPKLEEELSGFTTSGYTGENSPNRADAFVWAMSELFPGMVATKKEPKPAQSGHRHFATGGWMR